VGEVRKRGEGGQGQLTLLLVGTLSEHYMLQGKGTMALMTICSLCAQPICAPIPEFLRLPLQHK